MLWRVWEKVVKTNRAVGQGSLKKQKAVSLTAAAAHTMSIRPLLPAACLIIIFSGAHHHASVLIIAPMGHSATKTLRRDDGRGFGDTCRLRFHALHCTVRASR